MSDNNNSIVKSNAAIANTLDKSLKAKTLADLVRIKSDERKTLAIDCSASMDTPMYNGKRRIDGLREVVKGIREQVPCEMIVFDGGNARTVDGVPEPNGGTPMHEAIRFAKERGAGSLVVVSDGQPDWPQGTLDAAMAFGGRIDVVFVGNPGDFGEQFMIELAQKTGGIQFTGDLAEVKQITSGIVGLLTAGERDEDDDSPIAL